MSTFCRRSCEFQSTLPHGSDRERTQRHAAHGISIHAPSRERQGLLQLLAIGAGISILAPSRERHYSAGSAVCCIYFNPCSLPGATTRKQRNICAAAFQSTLPCGSDLRMHLTWKSRRHFNPRSLAGATKNLEKFKISSKFQSTLPCGSDAVPLHTLNAPRISIHAPLRERPNAEIARINADTISIHAPLRERLVMLVLVIIVLINFNPRSLAGATVRTSTIDHNYNKFQSTLPCGSDSSFLIFCVFCHNFNPRSLAGATPQTITTLIFRLDFNPRSLTGATICCYSDLVTLD